MAKSLTIIDLLLASMHGSQLQVAYQGVLDANSEPAVGKAYSNCEAIPCDQFEVAFQAVELWIADRSVLPIENSLSDSIHRNYDLTLMKRVLNPSHLTPTSLSLVRTHPHENRPQRRMRGS